MRPTIIAAAWVALACDRATPSRQAALTPPVAATGVAETTTRVVDIASTPIVDSSSLPAFAAGIYDLVLVRDKPLDDDSARARLVVDTGTSWGPLDGASTAADSTRVLIGFIDAQDPQWGEDRYALQREARTKADSAKVVADYLESRRCIAWHVGSELRLESSGRYTATHSWKRYCRGGQPAFTRYTHAERDSLTLCERPGPGMPSRLPHRTCNWGRMSTRSHFWHEGDTLGITRDCDGRDTFVLRATVPPPRVVATTAVFRDNRSC